MIRILVLGLVVSVAAGCTTAPPEEPDIAAVDDLKLPFDAYKPAPGQRALLNTAHRALVARCLKRRGVKPRTPLPAAPVDPGNSRRYGVADPAQARRYGYHLPTETPSRAKKARRVKGQIERALYGPDGCEEQAAARLGASDRAPWRWLVRRDARTLERSAERPGVRDAVARWAECMKAAGHPYPSPEAAIGDSRWDLEKPAISDDEKRTAVADATCKWSSGLVSRWHAADAALQRKLVHKHAGRFALLRTDLNERVQRATAILERHRSAKQKDAAHPDTTEPQRSPEHQG